MRKIDRNPPDLTGNPERDVMALRNYIAYLVEQLNWILTLIDKNGGT